MTGAKLAGLILLVLLLAFFGTVVVALFRIQSRGVTVRWRVREGVLTFTGPKLLAIPSVLHVPVDAISSAQIVQEPLTIPRGVRVGGTGLPNMKLGTFRGSMGRSWWAATRDRPAVRIDLAGRRYTFLVVSVADPDQLLAAVRTPAAS